KRMSDGAAPVTFKTELMVVEPFTARALVVAPVKEALVAKRFVAVSALDEAKPMKLARPVRFNTPLMVVEPFTYRAEVVAPVNVAFVMMAFVAPSEVLVEFVNEEFTPETMPLLETLKSVVVPTPFDEEEIVKSVSGFGKLKPVGSEVVETMMLKFAY